LDSAIEPRIETCYRGGYRRRLRSVTASVLMTRMLRHRATMLDHPPQKRRDPPGL
jgi:hypothetical protein